MFENIEDENWKETLQESYNDMEEENNRILAIPPHNRWN